jgi:hypothetical protein
VDCLKARGLSQGTGDYWSSRYGRLSGLTMPAISSQGEPDGWIAPRHRYLEVTRFEFVVLDRISDSAFPEERSRGEQIVCGGTPVLLPSPADQRELPRHYLEAAKRDFGVLPARTAAPALPAEESPLRK